MRQRHRLELSTQVLLLPEWFDKKSNMLGNSGVRPKGRIMEIDLDISADELAKAKAIVIATESASISALMRRMSVSYNKAAAIVEALENDGIVTPPGADGRRIVGSPQSSGGAVAQPTTQRNNTPQDHGVLKLIAVAVVIGLWYFALRPDDGKQKPSPLGRPMTSHEIVRVEPWRNSAWAEEMKDVVRRRLKDPQSAVFEGVETHHSMGVPAACGKVNSKNSFGGYAGAQRFIASGDLVFLESDMAPGAMDESWAKACH